MIVHVSTVDLTKPTDAELAAGVDIRPDALAFVRRLTESYGRRDLRPDPAEVRRAVDRALA